MGSAPEGPVTVDGKKYRHVREGLATVLAHYGPERDAVSGPRPARNNEEGNQAVFYNPIQQFNRDLSVLAITVYGEGAVAAKSAKAADKSQKWRAKKRKADRKAHDQDPTKPASTGSVDDANPRKRKATDLQSQDADPEAARKRPRPYTAENSPRDAPDDVTGDATGAAADEDLMTVEVEARTRRDDVVDGDAPHSNGHPPPAAGHEPPSAATSPPPPFTILDALSATGLRALRYAKEIPFATQIIANDISAAAVHNIEFNVRYNGVEAKVHPNLGDARAYMYERVGNEKSRHGYIHRFNVIDLDPYGTAAPFLDASLQALQDGGLLCVTCTDAGVFASIGYPEKTYAMYAGLPVKGPHSHEAGLRLILHAVAVAAARYGIAIEPLLSLSIDFYARLFVRIHRRPQEVKLLPGTTMAVYNCGHGCGAWTTQPLLRNVPETSKTGEPWTRFTLAQAPAASPHCAHCGFKTHLCGPMWAGPLHNPHFVQKMLDKIPTLDPHVYGTVARLEGMLTLALEEDLTAPPPDAATAAVDAPAATIMRPHPPGTVDPSPFFVMPTQLAKTIHCATPSEDMMRSALLSLGYRVSRSHCKPGSIKTNAPWAVLWEILREFMRLKAPIKDGAVKRGTAGWEILRRVRGTEAAVVADLRAGAQDQLRRCDTKEDMKTVLQGMLWRLEHDRPAAAAAAAAAMTDGETHEHHEPTLPSDAAPVASVEGPPSSSQATATSGPAIGTLNIVFDEKIGRAERRGRLVRYQVNPRENWGPMNRAGGKA